GSTVWAGRQRRRMAGSRPPRSRCGQRTGHPASRHQTRQRAAPPGL
ncbi:MAG: hypothetical protein AVDCRST_MAG47-403, partial [uncultured Nocardioidaceae bacterium]